jgi:hypothetical protein
MDELVDASLRSRRIRLRSGLAGRITSVSAWRRKRENEQHSKQWIQNERYFRRYPRQSGTRSADRLKLALSTSRHKFDATGV